MTSRFTVMECIDSHWRTHYRSPTFRELSDKTGLGLSTVFYHVNRLALEGMVTISTNRARTVTPLWVKKLIDEYTGGPDLPMVVKHVKPDRT